MSEQTALFAEDSKPEGFESLFGDSLDKLARERGGWPDNALAYAVEVVGRGEDPMVLVSGDVPIGRKRDGSPRFPKSEKNALKAGILLSEYRAALGVAT